MPYVDSPPTDKRVIGKYEVLGVLGEGGTGVVYDAVAPDGAPIALKVMHEQLAGDRQIRGRFQREAAILRRLEGDHLCPILDFGEVPGEKAGTTLLYIALPKIEGESLADLLAEGLLDVDRALDVLLEVLTALEAAHAQGVIHRDLKPANVLLERRPAGGGQPVRTRVVVVDFGMSKIITGTGIGTTNLTTHNMVFGTPEYMSPEQARGDELDARCDVYAAGIILHEVLTGAPPFTGDTPLSVLTAHLTSDLEPPSKRPNAGGRVTPALEAVILHALARERDARYPSAATLASAIRHARAAPNDLGSLRPEAFSASPRGTEAFAATLPSLPSDERVDVLASTLFGGSPAPRTTSTRPPPSPSQQPPRIPSLAPPPPTTTRAWVLTWIVVVIVSIACGLWFALR